MGPLFNLSPDLSAAELLGVDIDVGTILLDGLHESVQGQSRQRSGEVVRRYVAFTQNAGEGAGYQGGRRPSGVEPDDDATVATRFGGHMDVGHPGILQSGDA